MANHQQRAPGVQGVNEPVHENMSTQRFTLEKAQEFNTLEQLESAFVEKLANRARRRLRDIGGTEAEAVLAISEPRSVSEFEQAVGAFFRKWGEEKTPKELEIMWKKVRLQAIGSFYENPLEAPVEPVREQADEMPEPPAPPQQPEEETPSESEPVSNLMDSASWDAWDTKTPSTYKEDNPASEYKDLYQEYYAAFATELRGVLAQLPDDPALRNAELSGLKAIFFEHLFQMYMNDYPGKKGTDEEEEYRTDLRNSDWFNDRWKEVLEGAQSTLPA